MSRLFLQLVPDTYNVRTASAVHLAYYRVAIGTLFWEIRGQEVKVTTRVHLLQRLIRKASRVVSGVVGNYAQGQCCLYFHS